MSTKAEVILSGDDSPLRKALASARDNLNRFGQEAVQPFAKIRDAVGNLGNIMTALGAVKLTQLADEAALIQARLKDVSGSFTAAQQAQQALYASAQRLQVSYSDMAGSFSRMLPAVQQMGGGAAEAVKLSEILAVTARLAGASSAEASASAQQFAQALSSGVLQGDELKSILENNNTLARALAQGLGVTVGELRKLGSEGKLTADKVAGALLGQYDQISARSAELPATVGGAWQQVTNSFQQFVAAANEGTGIFAGVSAILSGMARVLDAVRATFAGTSSEADKLGRNNSVKAWGEALGAVFAWVLDMGRAVYQALQAVGRAVGGLAAAATAAARGDLAGAKAIWAEMVADAEASFARIRELATGGKGSTLYNYATNAGQDAGSALAASGPLRSTASGGKGKASGAGQASVMAGFEAAVQEQMALLAQHKLMLDGAKDYELHYWEQVLESAKLNEQEKLAVKKKIAALKLDVERENARAESAMQKEEADAWREMQLLKLDGARIAAKALRDQDQITKGQLIDKEIEFEERRLQIQLEYLERKRKLLAPNDALGQLQLGNEASQERQRSENKKAELGNEKSKSAGGFDFGGMAESMSANITDAFGQMVSKAQTWQASMLDIYKRVRDGFIKQVVLEPMQAQLAAWAKQLAAKLSFLAQGQAADTAASGVAVGTKIAEATAITSANAVEAGTGAAASQAQIPIVGPAMALASMAAIFAAVMAMGGKMKSARGGYDIPAGLNPVTQLHEEEMVLPKEQADAIRNMTAGGGGSGPQSVTVVVQAMDSRDVRRFLMDNQSAVADALKSALRDYKR